MTGGSVVVLGETGRNIAAGMTGGVLFIHDPQARVKGMLSDTAPTPHRLDAADAEVLKAIIAEHVDRTGSRRGAEILAEWDSAQRAFWVLRPEPPEMTDESGAEPVEIDIRVPAESTETETSTPDTPLRR